MTQKPTHLREEGTETLGLRAPGGAAQPSFRIVVTHGPDAPKEAVVDGGVASRVLVGTGSTCHVVLTDRSVSRRHLALSLRDGLLFVEDLGSTNGTFIGSLRIESVAVAGGEEIVLGGTRIRTERLATPAVRCGCARAASFGRVIGASVAMRALYPLAEALAKSHVPVLVEGEAGTGKELLAEVLHERGPRSAGSFLVLDPTGLEPDAIDGSLFGSAEQPGLLEQAHGGTLVLDEPSDLPLAVQTKLARHLGRHAVTRADGTPHPANDARLIAISRSDVEREVQAGRLREDLATLLGAARLELPPLRRREGDIAVLASAFFKALRIEDRVLPPITVRRFEAYSWPGNVRELEKAVIRFATSGDDETNPRNAFRDESREPSLDELCRRVLDADLALGTSRDVIVADFERRFVKNALERHGGNVTRAAASSGIARRYFHMLRVKHGV
jgi:two-component system, NtrC family, response regulator HydG